MAPSPGFGVWGPTSYVVTPVEAGGPTAPGVHRGTVAMGIRHDGKNSEPIFVVWVGDGGGGQIGVTGRPSAFDGKLVGVPFRCELSDDSAGVMKIAGESLPLDQGRLFLVSALERRPVVKQLPLSQLGLKSGGFPTIEDLRSIAANDEAIRMFWQPPKETK